MAVAPNSCNGNTKIMTNIPYATRPKTLTTFFFAPTPVHNSHGILPSPNSKSPSKPNLIADSPAQIAAIVSRLGSR